ncbi:proline-rich receptor-like protein kinase PERK10 [Zingiber officinale]|uniref:proline-rich receptor-like protein kinase PERK10 n=1 Tax=Zingiber officinale TaxID=94328 RepID=UPI001C4B35A2|nr:proline-rich receptor-like protein kinase PERK10 [Zingiber officinale]
MHCSMQKGRRFSPCFRRQQDGGIFLPVFRTLLAGAHSDFCTLLAGAHSDVGRHLGSSPSPPLSASVTIGRRGNLESPHDAAIRRTWRRPLSHLSPPASIGSHPLLLSMPPSPTVRHHHHWTDHVAYEHPSPEPPQLPPLCSPSPFSPVIGTPQRHYLSLSSPLPSPEPPPSSSLSSLSAHQQPSLLSPANAAGFAPLPALGTPDHVPFLPLMLSTISDHDRHVPSLSLRPCRTPAIHRGFGSNPSASS